MCLWKPEFSYLLYILVAYKAGLYRVGIVLDFINKYYLIHAIGTIFAIDEGRTCNKQEKKIVMLWKHYLKQKIHYFYNTWVSSLIQGHTSWGHSEIFLEISQFIFIIFFKNIILFNVRKWLSLMIVLFKLFWLQLFLTFKKVKKYIRV